MSGNKTFRRELARDMKLTLRQVDNLIFEKGQAVAELAGASCGGHNERQGVVFTVSQNTGTGSAFMAHAQFDYDIVINQPATVIRWAASRLAQMAQRATTNTSK